MELAELKFEAPRCGNLKTKVKPSVCPFCPLHCDDVNADALHYSLAKVDFLRHLVSLTLLMCRCWSLVSQRLIGRGLKSDCVM